MVGYRNNLQARKAVKKHEESASRVAQSGADQCSLMLASILEANCPFVKLSNLSTSRFSQAPVPSMAENPSPPPPIGASGVSTKPPTIGAPSGSAKPPTTEATSVSANPPTIGASNASANPPTIGAPDSSAKPHTTGTSSVPANPPTTGTSNMPANPPATGTSNVPAKPPTIGAPSVSAKPPTIGAPSVSAKLPATGLSSAFARPPTIGASSASAKPPTIGASGVASGVASSKAKGYPLILPPGKTAIAIPKADMILAALLFRPDNHSRILEAGAPAIIIVHPAGGVKEQVASVYADKLCKDGYITVCYDAMHQGESDGKPRLLEDPSVRVSDIIAVVDFLERTPGVDWNRILALGICGGGGYAVTAAKADHRIKGVIPVSAHNFGDSMRFGWLGGTSLKQHGDSLDRVAARVAAEAKLNGPPATVPYINLTPENRSIDMIDLYDYYTTPRGQHKNAPNLMLARSLPLIVTFDAWQFAGDFLNQPMLIVCGELAENRWQSVKLANMMDGKNKNAKVFVVPKARHVDLFDNHECIDKAIEAIGSYFRGMGC